MSAAKTSIVQYHSKIKGTHENSQNEIMLKAISEIQPCTARQVFNHIHCSIELSSVVRSINNLKKQNRIEVAKIAPCPISGTKCQFYKVLTGQLKML